MAALQIAKTNLTEKTITTSFLDELVAKGLIESSLVERITNDEDLAHFFIQEKPKKKKTSEKKTTKKPSSSKVAKVSDTDRNSEEYDPCRCCARIWKAEGGLGFDNIQCNSKNMVTAEEAKDILLKLECSPSEKDVEKFLEGYVGDFCKKHMSQDFMMPKGYWLGKVNEKRPEELMLPSGSIKNGYSEEYKPHRWMYDENGDKVEKAKRSSKKKEKVEEKVEEVNELTASQDNAAGTGLPKKTDEERDEMAEFLEWKKANHQETVEAHANEEEVEEKEEVEVEVEVEEKEEEGPVAETDDEEKTEELSDEEDPEDTVYCVDGIEYIKHWDEDEKAWIILEPEEYSKIGVPKEDGGIGFDSDEEDAHNERVHAAN